MMLDPTALLAGPRGRRLCLAVALRLLDDRDEDAQLLRQAVFFAAHALDQGQGTSRVVLFGPRGDTDAVPTPTPAEVAQLLDRVPIADPDEADLLAALADTVDFARYWQEPDGEDVLAAAPELQVPLARIAAAIAGAPHSAWWATPAAPEQWTVAFDGLPLPRAADAGRVQEVVERWRADAIAEEEAARRDRPSDPGGPWSGTWWSRPPAGLVSTTRALAGRGPVGLRLVEDGLGWEAARVERVRADAAARVLEIDGPEAWAELCRGFPLEVTASRRHDWYRATGRNGRWVVPDWAAVRGTVDAVHLSVAGYLATAGRAVPVDDDSATVLAGWDPDATFWLSEVRPDPSTRERWAREQGGDEWSRAAP
ncbi:hypothetical protein ACFDTO_09395 [Microbacteriaceae bacterium 4G12]